MVTAVGNSNTSLNSASPTSIAKGTSTGADFETFLKMLTTQIQNQNPLNPMESTEFAVQLATFSGVEQQARTNSLLTELVQGTGGGQLGQLSGWIGREIRSTAPVLYEGNPVTLQIDPAVDADSVSLIVIDKNGKEITREDIGTGTGEVDWQGRDADGALLPNGEYQFRLESKQGDKVIGLTEVASYSEVKGVELTKTGPALRLASGAIIAVDDVTAVRE